MREILRKIIESLAKIRLARFKPVIIGVTGNVGKSSTKEAIIAALKNNKRVRGSDGNLNNEFGVPLSILGGNWSQEYYDKGPSLFFWLRVILIESLKCLLLIKEKSEVLVLEYGADAPGDIKKLANKYTPDIAIVTAVGDIPVHLEFFKDADHLANEKMDLIRATIQKGGLGVTNRDDARLLKLSSEYKDIKYFGQAMEADSVFSDYKEEYNSGLLVGSSLRVNNQIVNLRVIGRSQGYSVSCAILIANLLGINLNEAIKSIESNYKGLKGRLSILKGINNSIILDDTYNSSPAATENALNTLQGIESKRKIAILGDMLELGGASAKAHKEIGYLACRFVNLLICVGERSKETALEAERLLSKEKIFWFKDSKEASSFIPSIIEEGDIILVKGSQGIRMERIVKSILSPNLNPKEVLVRQSEKWLNS